MPQKTGIEWASHTSNPIAARDMATDASGWICQRISPGCANCYAARWNKRLGTGHDYTAAGVTATTMQLKVDELAKLRRMRGPATVFVGDMTDIFLDAVPDWMLHQLWATFACNPRVTFMILTKRPARMRSFLTADGRAETIWTNACAMAPDTVLKHTLRPWPLPNVWIGVSAEDQQRADERREDFLSCPAALRFVSLEPLLGPVDLADWQDGIGWVITGGESGSDARPMHPRWARTVRDQCQAAGTPFFHKQNGEWVAKPEIADFDPNKYGSDIPGWRVRDAYTAAYQRAMDKDRWGVLDNDGTYCATATTWNGRQESPEDNYEVTMVRLGKKAAGACLGGREWREVPDVQRS